MQHTTRLADATTASDYPLPVERVRDTTTERSANWRQHSAETWVLEIELPPIPKGHIIVPSLSLPGRAVLTWFAELEPGNTPRHSYPLQSVPAVEKAGDLPPGATAVSRHIDCWHSEQDLSASVCRLYVNTKQPPATYLATLSVRPLTLAGEDLTAHTSNVAFEVPATFSQHNAQPELRRRICSPTALAMALSCYPQPAAWEDTVAACYDRATRAYGAWPLAIQWAAGQQVAGAVEVFSDWQAPMSCLAAGVALVCSIDYESGTLDNSPMPRTGGHLVVLYGIEGNEVLVKDPAGATNAEVARRYDLKQFSEAWLRRRGAAYVLATRQH